MIGRVLFATVVGLAFGSVAAVFGHYLAALLNPTHPPELSRSFFVVTPAVSAGLAAAITWWFVVIRPGNPGWVRGAIADLVVDCVKQAHGVTVIVNNKAEGSSPLSVIALSRLIVDSSAS